MKISARLQRLETQINEQQAREMDGVIFYDAWTGEFRGAYKWKPGEKHTRKMVEVNGHLRPEGFTGVMIIDDIPRK